MISTAPARPSPILAPVLDGGMFAGRSSTSSRVLLVEDELLIALELESALDAAGYQVVGTAVSAAEAVALAVAFEPDLVVMDIRLQGARDGIDAAIEIHAATGIRSLFISANDDPATRERARAANPLGWLGKPFQGSELVACIDALRT